MSFGIGSACSSLWSRLCGSSGSEGNSEEGVTSSGSDAASGSGAASAVCQQPTSSASTEGNGPSVQIPMVGTYSANVQSLVNQGHGGRGFVNRCYQKYSASGVSLTSISIGAGDSVDGPLPSVVITRQPQGSGSSARGAGSLQMGAVLSGMSTLTGNSIFDLFGESQITNLIGDAVDGTSTSSSPLRDATKGASTADLIALFLALGGSGSQGVNSPLVATLLSRYSLSGSLDAKKLQELLEALKKLQNDAPTSDGARPGLGECCTHLCGALSSSPNPIVSAVGIAGTGLTELLMLAAQSQRVRKGALLCHDACKPCCASACGYPSCGCADGEGGCGSFGALVCSCAELWCCQESPAEEANLEEYARKLKDLEMAVGSTTFMLGLHNLGISFSDLVKGNFTNLPTPEQLETACKDAVSSLGKLMMRITQEKWLGRLCSCAGILDNPFWKRALCSGLAGGTHMLSLQDLTSRVKVITSSGNKQEAENLDLELLLPALSSLQVTGTEEDCDDEGQGLNTDQLTMLLCKFCSVLSAAIGNDRRPIWLTPKQITEILCVCMVMSGISIVGGPSNQSVEYQEFQNTVMQESLTHLQSSLRVSKRTNNRTRAEVRKLVVKYEAQSSFLSLLEGLRDPNSKESKDLMRECFASWAQKAGVQSSSI
ncbi:hypothetical protein [Chlamydia trachomatis]|uniref:hypothetical protein n=1 Tax=Chlamydia trachomatis TaxID=813 RepID=UPI0002A83ADD|nr:hypothetical protein [Chlamydia trachomatis]CCP66589.1 hypothetical protein L3404_00106 [Chlamydia trachomatis L3/404/LN]